MFSNLGNCYKVDTESVPEGSWREKGTPLTDIVPSALKNEKILFVKAYGEKMPNGNLLFCTSSGMVKKSEWKEYDVAKSAFQAVKLKDGEEVVGIEEEKSEVTLLFVTQNGMCLNADMSDIPLQGRIAAGVKGIQLSDGDRCIYASQVTEEGEIAVITDKSYAKRVQVCQVDPMARYRKGVKLIDFKGSNGSKLIFASYVTIPYTIILDVEDDYLSAYDTEDLSILNRVSPGKALVRGCEGIEKVYIYK